MQEAYLFRVPRRLQGCFQPSGLPRQHLAVVRPLVVQLIEPAPCAAQRRSVVKQAVVVEYFNGIQPVVREKALHFRRGVPPVIVVALQDDLAPRQGVDEPKIKE